MDRLERERTFQNQKVVLGTYAKISPYLYDGQMHSAIECAFERLNPLNGLRVLELGCGMGQFTARLAEMGADVYAIDISEASIFHVEGKLREAGFRANLSVMNAEKLEFPPASFDVVFGGAILHHLVLDKAMPEIKRVLKPGGHAVFVEPLGHNPVINLYRRVTPHLHTPDEHPITRTDLAYMKGVFPHVEVEPFYFLTIVVTMLRFLLRRPDFGASLFRMVERADGYLLKKWLPLQLWCRTAVLVLHT